MKKLRNCLLNLLICTSFINFHLSIIYKNKLSEFNTTNVVDNITHLSSDDFEGRLCGSEGNFKAEDLIKQNFRNNNIKPFTKDYLSSFSTFCPNLINGEPYLRIKDSKGEIVRDFKYNRDFKDSFLNFKSNNISFSKEDSIKVYPYGLEVVKDDKNFIFYTSSMDSFNFRSSFVHDAPGDLYTVISPKTYNEVIDAYKTGLTIECYFPYEVVEKEVNNLVGVIKGLNPKLPPLVICGHFDHMGKDLDGNIYRGALDNASGISFVMEMSRFLKTLPPPDRNILVVALNAEEFGLLGSKSFAKSYKDYLTNAKVINFDMIGSDNNIPLTLMSGENSFRMKGLLSDFRTYCDEKKITHLVEFKDSSDHASFLNLGIDAITLCDGDISKIHTPEDNVEYISKTAIDRAFNVSWEEIRDYAYKDSPFFLLDTKISILLGVTSLILVILKSSFKD